MVMINSWKGMSAYAYPPIPRATINKLQADGAEVILVAPAWPNQEWFPDLLSLIVDTPLQLPQWEKLLKQPHRQLFHSQPWVLNLHVWRLSPDISTRKDFLNRLQKLSHHTIELQLQACTNQNKNSSLIGATQNRLINSRPLFHR